MQMDRDGNAVCQATHYRPFTIRSLQACFYSNCANGICECRHRFASGWPKRLVTGTGRAAYAWAGSRFALNAVGVVLYQDLNALEKLLWSVYPRR